MMKKYLLIPTMLSLALLLLAADTAQAQRLNIGFGGRGISIGNGGYNGGNYGRGYYGNGYNNGYYGGYNNSPFYSGYYNPYSGGYYGNSYYSAPRISYYNDPAPVVAVQYAPVADSSANVRVIVPDPAARVWMNGNLTQQTGTDRIFSTPTLTPGYSYSYRVRATWTQAGREMTQEKEVAVVPGQTAVADFR